MLSQLALASRYSSAAQALKQQRWLRVATCTGMIIAPHLEARHLMLGTTFGGNHLACAAALAVLEVIEQEKLMANAAEVGGYLMEKLKKIPL